MAGARGQANQVREGGSGKSFEHASKHVVIHTSVKSKEMGADCRAPRPIKNVI